MLRVLFSLFFVAAILWSCSGRAETNTISSTIIDKSVPASIAPNVVINNSDVCVTSSSGAVTNLLPMLLVSIPIMATLRTRVTPEESETCAWSAGT